MKTKLAYIKTGIYVILIGTLIGLVYYLITLERQQPTGYYTAQDTLNSYNRGYQDGAENTREVIKSERTDYTVRSCQDR